MKKLTTLALALALAASLAVPAFAANTTTLTTTVPAATYTLNIPADQEIPFGKTSTNIGSISVTDGVGFASGKDLKVTLTYDAFASEAADTTIPFSIRLEGSADNHTIGKGFLNIKSGSALTFEGQSNGAVKEFAQTKVEAHNIPSGYLYYDADQTYVTISSTDWGKALAGNYSATITFTAEVVSG